MRVLLGPGRLYPYISTELAGSYIAAIHMIDSLKAQMPFDLIEVLYTDNRKLFAEIHVKQPLPDRFVINDQLLLYKDYLYVNYYMELYTKLICEVYDQVSVAYPSGKKTYQLLAPKYH